MEEGEIKFEILFYVGLFFLGKSYEVDWYVNLMCYGMNLYDGATATQAKEANQQSVKLTLAGLPRREGAINCPYYMKTGACKYGATCKFDHPPPGEVMAFATSQGVSTTNGAEGNDDKKVAETTEG